MTYTIITCFFGAILIGSGIAVLYSIYKDIKLHKKYKKGHCIKLNLSANK